PPHRRTVAAERDRLEAPALRPEDPRSDVPGCEQRHASLLFPPAPEPVCRRAARSVAAVDEPLADLRGDEPLALEHADRVASEPYEHRAHTTVPGDLLQQRLHAHDAVLAGVAQGERRPADER